MVSNASEIDAKCREICLEKIYEIKRGQVGFDTKLNNASEDMFTFVNHPGMEKPTNTESEGMLRLIAIDRKIRH